MVLQRALQRRVPGRSGVRGVLHAGKDAARELESRGTKRGAQENVRQGGQRVRVRARGNGSDEAVPARRKPQDVPSVAEVLRAAGARAVRERVLVRARCRVRDGGEEEALLQHSFQRSEGYHAALPAAAWAAPSKRPVDELVRRRHGACFERVPRVEAQVRRGCRALACRAHTKGVHATKPSAGRLASERCGGRWGSLARCDVRANP